MPLPTPLVVKNGSKIFAIDFGRHAGAGVGDFDQHIFAGREADDVAHLLAFALADVARAYRQLAASRHGVAGVAHQVEDDVEDLIAVGAHVPQIALGLDLEVDFLADRGLQDRHHVRGQIAEIEHRDLLRLLAREAQQDWRQERRRGWRPTECS